MERWDHQRRGVEAVLAKIEEGHRLICLACPTGGGKSLMAYDVAEHYLKLGKKVVLYTHRKQLRDQMSDSLVDAGFAHGLRGGADECDVDHPFQISMLQTEHRRGVKNETRELHRAALVLVDEAHLHTNEQSQKVFAKHREMDDAVILMISATPMGMAEVCDCLVQAGTNSELRKCGALVVANHFGPDEPDMKSLKKLKVQEGKDLSENQQRKAMNVPALWGRVWEWYEKLNPEHHPGILFAPGVGESLWFAQQFTAKGVRSAHMDGDNIWLDGEMHRNSKTLRKEIREMSKAGDLPVVSNRFVMREGADWPWLRHGILATIFGGLQSYLQAGGRLLRAYAGKPHATIQDHGGNYWRHGSLNVDRIWELEFDASALYGLRADDIREGRAPRPWSCPSCSQVNTRPFCVCGYVPRGKKPVPRAVLTAEGELKQINAQIFAPQRVTKNPDHMRDWERIYWASAKYKKARTFRAAEVLFAMDHFWAYPDRSWPFMPADPQDIYRAIGSVPMERLILTPEQVEKYMPQEAAV